MSKFNKINKKSDKTNVLSSSSEVSLVETSPACKSSNPKKPKWVQPVKIEEEKKVKENTSTLFSLIPCGEKFFRKFLKRPKDVTKPNSIEPGSIINHRLYDIDPLNILATISDHMPVHAIYYVGDAKEYPIRIVSFNVALNRMAHRHIDGIVNFGLAGKDAKWNGRAPGCEFLEDQIRREYVCKYLQTIECDIMFLQEIDEASCEILRRDLLCDVHLSQKADSNCGGNAILIKNNSIVLKCVKPIIERWIHRGKPGEKMTGQSIDIIAFGTELKIANFHLDCGAATVALKSDFIQRYFINSDIILGDFNRFEDIVKKSNKGIVNISDHTDGFDHSSDIDHIFVKQKYIDSLEKKEP